MSGAADDGARGERGVIAAAVSEAAGAVAADRAPDEQLGLFEAPAGRRMDVEQAAEDHAARRGRGRPPGAANRSTRELREWLMRGGVLPQRWMMDWLLLSVEELAARLQCSRLEAFDRQASLADRLGRYFMPHLAPTDAQGAAVPMVALMVGGQAVNGAATGSAPPWARAFEDVEYQELSDGDAAQSPLDQSPPEENP
ncbi:hypothetical protein [Chelatococcus asaccharovorans]|uniref:Uncharacterized protein n=1 Tax=Chelatococcus asaccharovorans TaxID=28210 RepID=A0A2V3UAK0_9HYPH|nr:hypothetical protein [Chelatococcus asaccharovorans]MBS7703186.1 hypothetical protein [Chelatococcus asaccharovorans]PXW61515.1 hypothetical protein C7450_10330 [Chelatococcus asaccharovorans]